MKIGENYKPSKRLIKELKKKKAINEIKKTPKDIKLLKKIK